jgi:hypothetical protein
MHKTIDDDDSDIPKCRLLNLTVTLDQTRSIEIFFFLLGVGGVQRFDICLGVTKIRSTA